MICHSFLQEGGGSSLEQLVIVLVVIIGSGGRGSGLRCTMSLSLPFFFFEGIPYSIWRRIESKHTCINNAHIVDEGV